MQDPINHSILQLLDPPATMRVHKRVQVARFVRRFMSLQRIFLPRSVLHLDGRGASNR